jgi:Glycosyl transferase family 2
MNQEMDEDQIIPRISVIILTPDSYNTIYKTIHSLRLQTVKNRMEIIIVVPLQAELHPDLSELEHFQQHRIVEIGKMRSIGSAYAAGIRAASAPVVVLAEDHSYPKPGWADALLRAHDGSWVAVGPVIGNANPNSLVSWADLYIAYGEWIDSTEQQSMTHLPGHNSSYKRSILLEYGAALEAMMEAESILHWNLQGRGYQLCLEPAARTLHTNFGRLSSFLTAQFYNGRQFAASRAKNESWTLSRRLFYCAAAPLIPVVRFWRILRHLRQAKKKHPIAFVLPALISGLVVDGAGQLIGIVTGSGNATEKMVQLEFHRDQHQ